MTIPPANVSSSLRAISTEEWVSAGAVVGWDSNQV